MTTLSWIAVATAITTPRVGTPIPAPTETIVVALASRWPPDRGNDWPLVAVDVTVMAAGASPIAPSGLRPIGFRPGG